MGFYERLSRACDAAHDLKTKSKRPSKTVLGRLFPDADPADYIYLLALRNIVLEDVDKHCIGHNLRGERCGKDTTPRNFMLGIQKTNHLSSNVAVTYNMLMEAARYHLCRCFHYRKPHREQADGIVRRWVREAQEATVEAVAGQACRVEKRGRYRAKGGRVKREPVDDEKIGDVKPVKVEEPGYYEDGDDDEQVQCATQ